MTMYVRKHSLQPQIRSDQFWMFSATLLPRLLHNDATTKHCEFSPARIRGFFCASTVR